MAKKTLPAALIGAIVLLLGTTLIWSAGFLYWQFRISRVLSIARDEARKLPEDDWTDDVEFGKAGSRSFPRLLAELRRAIAEKDRPVALRMCRDLAMQTRIIYDHLDSPYFVSQATYVKSTASWEAFQGALTQCEEWWTREQPHYPPWWVWWKGTRISA